MTNDTLLFVGKAWLNVAKTGKKYYTIRFDRAIKPFAVTDKTELLAFANRKREGKKDADLRLAIRG